ncbi:MAG TPA: RHS repeat-associated core domain-containing protein, partial [Holophaga sp.]|nr:RHS repeat-associated core domain-containing protein [Holophaga sp.]
EDPSLRCEATVMVAGATREDTYAFDENGNLLRDGQRLFEWDAENRLVSVTILATGHRSEFGYDGMGRRVVIRELDPDASQNLQVTSDKKYLWEGVEIAHERSADGGTVLRQFYQQGFVDTDGTVLFYTKDHLGSVRELTDGTQAVRARYDHDPTGRMIKIQGDKDSLFGFAEMVWHAPSSLNLTYYRQFDPEVSRWISRDPIEEFGGVNLYVYSANSPTNYTDPLGLFPSPWSVFKCVKTCRKAYKDIPPAHNPFEPAPVPPGEKDPAGCDGTPTDDEVDQYRRAKQQQRDRLKGSAPGLLDCLKACWSMAQPFGGWKPNPQSSYFP